MNKSTNDSKAAAPGRYRYCHYREKGNHCWTLFDEDGIEMAKLPWWFPYRWASTTARLIVHRLNRHDELLAALNGLLAVFDEEIAAGVMWRDARISHARRVYAKAAKIIRR